MPETVSVRDKIGGDRRRRHLPLLFLLVAVLFALPALATAGQRNRLALQTVRALSSGDPAPLSTTGGVLSAYPGEACWASWLSGLVQDRLGDLEQRDQAWEAAMRCSPAYIDLARAAAYADKRLAQAVVQAQPAQAQAWFWLAELQLQESPREAIQAYWQGLQRDPHFLRGWAEMGRAFAALDPQEAAQIYAGLGMEQLSGADPLLSSEPLFILASILAAEQPTRAIQLYRQGLAAKPYDGVRWYELGDLLAESDSQAALAAYHQACHNGDPGSHGCYPAGLIAEELGDLSLALQYYRLSRYEGAAQRAAELEKQLP